MKRFTAAFVAAATTMCLAVAPAYAETDTDSAATDAEPAATDAEPAEPGTEPASETPQGKSSSEVSEQEVRNYFEKLRFVDNQANGGGISRPYRSSSEDGLTPTDKDLQGTDVDSSLRHDFVRGYKIGTTWDMLFGLGFTAALLLALGGALAWADYQGWLPIIQLTF